MPRVKIQKISADRAEEIHTIQRACFLPLLEKYKDYATNPAMESVEMISRKINNPATDSYVFTVDSVHVGWVRITHTGNGTYKVSALCVLPEYQNRGIAQEAVRRIEAMYPSAEKWVLATISEEKGDCHLYEKLGYVKTGETEKINERMTIIGYEKVLRS